MKDRDSPPTRQPQPWHAADEKPADAQRGAERSEAREERLRPDAAPDLLKEPRAGMGDLLGRKP